MWWISNPFLTVETVWKIYIAHGFNRGYEWVILVYEPFQRFYSVLHNEEMVETIIIQRVHFLPTVETVGYTGSRMKFYSLKTKLIESFILA